MAALYRTREHWNKIRKIGRFDWEYKKTFKQIAIERSDRRIDMLFFNICTVSVRALKMYE